MPDLLGCLLQFPFAIILFEACGSFTYFVQLQRKDEHLVSLHSFGMIQSSHPTLMQFAVQ